MVMKTTLASLLRNVEQQLQSLLDAYPNQCRVTIQASWLAHWRDTLTTARVALEEPRGVTDVPGVVLSAIVATLGAGVVLGWLLGCQ
jgi:hypothetical protein